MALIILDDSDGNDFFHAWGATEHIEADFIECVRPPAPLDPVVIQQRNEAITRAWACKDRRQRQSLATKAKHAQGGFPHSDPTFKQRMSATMKAVYECPKVREKASKVRKAYWDNNPEMKARLSENRKAYWAKRREERSTSADQ